MDKFLAKIVLLLVCVATLTGSVIAAFFLLNPEGTFNTVERLIGDATDVETEMAVEESFTKVIANELRERAQLVTAELELTTTVKVDDTARVIGMQVGMTEVIYQATGIVQAGIDLDVDISDIRIEGGTVFINVGPARLLSYGLIPEKSQVISSERRWLGPETQAELTDYSQEIAMGNILAAAEEQQILSKAEEQAAAVLQQLIGYEVVLNFEP